MDKIIGNKKIAKFMGYTYYPYTYERKLLDPHFISGWKLKEDAHWLQKNNRLKYPFEPRINKMYLCRSHSSLIYHRDYNWLMEVVEKIEALDKSNGLPADANRRFNVILQNPSGVGYVDHLGCYKFVVPCDVRVFGESRIHAIWLAVVYFIDWYNAQGL